MVKDVPTCKCHSLYTGDRCQIYRCSQYCKNKGLCFADLLATLPSDLSPPLKVLYTYLLNVHMAFIHSFYCVHTHDVEDLS
jgi:hypothetical protein